MSATYTWRPATPPPPTADADLSLGLMDLVAARHSLDGRNYLDGSELDNYWLPWLVGVAAATSSPDIKSDADQLAEAIRQHGRIVIVVER